MTAGDRRRQIEDLCHAALERDPASRAAFVATACGSDEALRREVEALLAHAQVAESFLSTPLDALAAQALAAERGDSLLGRSLGPYRLRARIGSGGMGEVYRAHDTTLGREVAIEILPAAFTSDPERLARFERESRLLASLNHPNIATLHGLEEAQGIRALVMELVEGPTLAERVANGPLPIKEALTIATQVADALGAAHERGIVHRDLKPANIKITPDGRVKVLDFGLAKLDSRAGDPSDLSQSPTMTMSGTKEGLVLGTAAYMSPEQAAGKAADKRSDLWSFGVVLLEMLTGKPVFPGETITHVLAAVLRAEPDWTALPTTTPAPIRRLLRRCLEKDRTRRLESAADARLEIEEALTTPTAEASPVGGRPRVALPITFAAGGAIVALLATWAVMRPTPEHRPLIRFSADLGPDAVRDEALSLAISRDGTRIAFPIRGTNGTTQLATRLLGEATPTSLPGTENGSFPFFSPDGQWIAFLADGKLKKISVLGGAAITLCDALFFHGGSWGEDGTIIAALSWNTGLSRIPAAGGVPQPLTTLVNGETSHRWPQILPGGQAVLFAASSRITFEDAAIQVLSLQTGQIKTLVHGYYARYLPGHLAYFREGVLFGVRFNLSRLEVRGTPVPLLDDVANVGYVGMSALDVSDTGTVVYLSGGAAAVYPVVWLDSSGQTNPLLARPDAYYHLRVSPEGRRLALSIYAGKTVNIYTYDMPRDRLLRLTFDDNNEKPIWTRDGAHLVYLSGADRTIKWIRADGAGEVQRLLEGKNMPVPWSFSPDGRYLAYQDVTVTSPGDYDLLILPVDASDPEHVKPGTPEVFLKTPAREGAPAFSPDGRWISYFSDESGEFEVYVRPFHRAAGGKWQISTSGGSYSYWSRDGRTLYYLAQNQRIMGVEYTATGESFTSRTPRVWSETPIRTSGLGFEPLDLAPDGKRFAILASEGAAEREGSVHATFLLNFVDELQRRLP